MASKALRWILSLVLVAGLVPVTAFALDDAENESVAIEEPELVAEEQGSEAEELIADEGEPAPQAEGDGGVQEGPTVLEEGDFGEEDVLHWVYKDDASLTISGTGAMPDFTEDGGQPWNAYLRTVEKLTIEEGVENIGAYAFYESRILAEAVLPESLIRIGDYAFYYNEKVTEFHLSDSIEIIGTHAFENCSRLRSFKAPSGLTELSDSVLAGCGTVYGASNRFSVSLHAGITRIGASALSRCSFTTLELPSCLEFIGSSAFHSTTIYSDFMLPALKYNPSYLGYYTVEGTLILSEGMSTAAANEVVSSCDCQYIQLPASLDRFTYSPRTNMPAGVERGFIVDPDNPNYIAQDGMLFSRCNGDKEYESKTAVLCACPSSKQYTDYALPEGTKVVLRCPPCVNLTVPASVEEIVSPGGSAWINVHQDNAHYASADGILYTKDMKRLIYCPTQYSGNPHIRIPGGVETINSRAFYYRSTIKSVSLPDGVKSIEGDCFYGCANLAAVRIPMSLETVAMYAFWHVAEKGRDGLTVFYAGRESEWPKASIASFGNSALTSSKRYYDVKSFGVCEDQLLYYVDMQDTLHVVSDVQLNSLSAVMMDYSTAQPMWLQNDEYFTRLELDLSIERISDGAFRDSDDLEEVVLHRMIKSVGAAAFANCPKLKRVICSGEPPTVTPAVDTGASFDAGLVTIEYPHNASSWLSVINTTQSVPTWQGYVVSGYQPEGLPKVSTAQIIRNGKEVTDLTVVGYQWSYVAPHECSIQVLDEGGANITDKVGINIEAPARKRPLNKYWESGRREPYYDEAAQMIKVPEVSPEGDYRVEISPKEYESEGDVLVTTFHVTRENEDQCLLVVNGQHISSGATRALKAYGRYSTADHEMTIDVCNRYYETVFDELDALVIDSLSNEDVTDHTEERGFRITGAPDQKIVSENMAPDRTYAISWTYKNPSIKGKVDFNLRIERESSLMNIPYTLDLRGGDETIELGEGATWSSKPLRARVLDGFDDPCWPNLSWIVKDESGNDVTRFFQIDEQGYIKVDPSLRATLDASGSSSAFTVCAQAKGVVGYDAVNDRADLTPLMRTSNEIKFFVKRHTEPPAPVTHVATFKVGDEVIGQVTFAEGDTSLETPALPPKANYVGQWETAGKPWAEFDLSSATTDVEVAGVYAPLDPDAVSKVEGGGDAEYKDGVVTVNLRASASSRNVRVESSSTKPVDVVLVCDQSGSMDQKLGGGITKRDALVNCANDFVGKLSENAKRTGAEHRVALVGFGCTNFKGNYAGSGLLATNSSSNFVGYSRAKAQYGNALMSINVGESVNQRILAGIRNVSTNGATAAHLGLEMASGIFASNPVGQGTAAGDRERIVLFITDGTPTLYYTNQTVNKTSAYDQVNVVAADAIKQAGSLKQSQGARIYSIGVEAKANAAAENLYGDNGIEKPMWPSSEVSFDFNRFLHAVSSDFPAATSMRNMGPGSKDAGYYMPVTNTSALDGIFTRILMSTVYTVEVFDRATLRYEVPAGLALTLKQEEEMRADLEAQGISSNDISVLRENGKTILTFRNVPVKQTLKDGVPIFVAQVSFKLSATPGTSGQVPMGSVDVDCMGEASQHGLSNITVPADRCLVVFNMDGVPYEIREMQMGDAIEAPDTDLARWLAFEKLQDPKVTGPVAVFETTSLTRTYAMHWVVNGTDRIVHLTPGSAVAVPDVSDLIPEGYEVAGWSPAPPLSMPSGDMTCTAVVTESHKHAYTASAYKTGYCTDGMEVHNVCACGEEEVTREAPLAEHAFTTVLSNEGTYTATTKRHLVCKDCGYSMEMEMEYEAAEGDDEVVVLDLTKVQAEAEKPGASDDDIEVKVFMDAEDGEEYTVTRIDEDDTRTDYPPTVRDGYVWFYPNHFSIYVIGKKDAAGVSASDVVTYADSLERLERAATEDPGEGELPDDPGKLPQDPDDENQGSGDDGNGNGNQGGQGGGSGSGDGPDANGGVDSGDDAVLTDPAQPNQGVVGGEPLPQTGDVALGQAFAFLSVAFAASACAWGLRQHRRKKRA